MAFRSVLQFAVFRDDQAVVFIVPSVYDIYFFCFLVSEYVEIVTQQLHLGCGILDRFWHDRVSLGSDELSVFESGDPAFFDLANRLLGELLGDGQPESAFDIASILI